MSQPQVLLGQLVPGLPQRGTAARIGAMRPLLVQLLLCVPLLLFIHSFVAAAMNGFTGYEAVFSSLRILISTVAVVLIHPYVTPKTLIRTIYYFGAANSILALLQILDLFFKLELLPTWLQYGQLFGLGEAAFVEVWRQGGIVPSLQTSSLLALAGIVIGASVGNRLLYFILFPFMCCALVFGARTLLLVSPIALLYVLYRGQRAVLLWIPIVLIAATQLDGFNEFASLRFGSLYRILVTGSIDSDYSAADTLSQYRGISSAWDFLFGNGCDRYSPCGGGDPLYSRWLVQAGAPALILVTALMMILMSLGFSYSIGAAAAVFALMLHAIKGELITSALVYDALALLLLSLTAKRSGFASSQSRLGMQPEADRPQAGIQPHSS